MVAYLIDREGQVWPAASRELRTALHAALPDEELRAYLVRNLGFVQLDVHAHGIQVHLRPHSVSEPATATMLDEIARRRPRRVVVSSLDRAWRTDIVGDHVRALGHLSTLVDAAMAETSGRFKRTPVAAAAMPGRHPLRALLGVWHQLRGHWSTGALEPLLHGELRRRFAVSRIASGSERIELLEFGRGYEQNAVHWVQRARGLPLEDQPDHAFGCWVAATYREVARSGAPAMDHVDASLRWPRRMPQRYRYLRLLLPFTDSGCRLILSASTLDGGYFPNVEPVQEFS